MPLKREYLDDKILCDKLENGNLKLSWVVIGHVYIPNIFILVDKEWYSLGDLRIWKQNDECICNDICSESILNNIDDIINNIRYNKKNKLLN